MDECKFYPNCLGHFRIRVLADTVVYVHLLPWFPVLDVFLLLGGRWVKVAGGRWDYCIDYDFVLWWNFGAGEDYDDSENYDRG